MQYNKKRQESGVFMGKRAVVISCTDHYAERMGCWVNALTDSGYNTGYVTADYSHTKKQHYICSVKGSIQLPVIPYKKNLSIERILSHRKFAKNVYRYLEEQKFDVVVSEIPPNFLCKYLGKFKRKYPQTKLIFDVFDLWPETFPSSKLKRLLTPVFKVWASLRDKNISSADYVVTECNMFREKLGLSKDLSSAIYLSADSVENSSAELKEDIVELCYLGSINNIIDIPAICNLIKQIASKKAVKLHIIGNGEKQDEFVESSKQSGAEVVFYGPVYDAQKKQEIMKKCRFGLNIMKSSVCVGLTMKSVDYFRFGLPIINNIPADTANLVEKEKIGFQLDEKCCKNILNTSVAECIEMRDRVKEVFFREFESLKINQQYKSVLEKIL